MDNRKWAFKYWLQYFNKILKSKNFSLNLNAYSLIELIVVIAIISMLALVGFVSFKRFSADQVTIKAAGVMQTYLRLAQSNASTLTLCDPIALADKAAVSWYLVINSNDITLFCDTSSVTINVSNYTLDTDAKISSFMCSGVPVSFPVTLKYTLGNGLLASPCTFTISNVSTSNPTTLKKNFSLSTGGAIDIQ